MADDLRTDRLTVLRGYAAGQLGTRQTLALLDLDDYADLVIALAQQNLCLPKPADTPAHRDHVARASAILQPLLRHAD